MLALFLAQLLTLCVKKSTSRFSSLRAPTAKRLKPWLTKCAPTRTVRTIEIATSEDEYATFIDDNQDNAELLAALEDENMYQHMLSAMQATMRIKVTDPNNLEGVRYIVDNSAIFQANLDSTKEPTYNVNQAEIETINSWATIAKMVGLSSAQYS